MRGSVFVVVLLMAVATLGLPASTTTNLAIEPPIRSTPGSPFPSLPVVDGLPPPGNARPGPPARNASGLLDSLGGYFTENRGQIAAPVRYYSFGDTAIGFRDDGVMFLLREDSTEGRARDARDDSGKPPRQALVSTAEHRGARLHAILLRFDAGQQVPPVGRDVLPFRNNYLIANDPMRWRTDVPNYREIAYLDLYPGIDAIFRASPNGVKYEFQLRPGADPGAIRLTYDGVESLRVLNGGVVVNTPLGDIYEAPPYSYQGTGNVVGCHFVSRGPRSYGFACPGRDASQVLTIDPLVYSTFLGGSDSTCGDGDRGTSVDVDAAGNAYILGSTCSMDFPVTPGAFDMTLNLGFCDPRSELPYPDAFVLKLGASGGNLQYATYLGGVCSEYPAGIAVDAAGNAFVTGTTFSLDYPTTPGVFNPTFYRFSSSLYFSEAFVTGLNAMGNGLLYSTFLGGSGSDEEGSSIAVDGFGIAYVAGWTDSADFLTTPDAFDRTLGGIEDAFLVKLLPATAADEPDLAIAPADISFDPLPARVGISVTITATVRNLGGTNATDVLVRFHDGPPSPSNQIGGDQVIPLVERFFGSGLASVGWLAGPAGTHAIWVVVDPVDAISEKREDNNAASTSIEVLPLEPNLTVSASDLSLRPAPPYAPGASVQIAAAVHNTGGAPSDSTAARFYDITVNPPTIGTDQAVPTLAGGDTATVSVQWTAASSGMHTLCVVVDPMNLVAEMEEGDNIACVQARVLTPPDLEPTAIALAPAPPLAYGSIAWANVTVANRGEVAAGTFEVLLFDDGNGDRVPDPGEELGRTTVQGLAGNGQTIASVGWSVSRAGDRTVCALADPAPGSIPESNEANNLRCVDVTVRAPPPMTSLVVGSPNVTAGGTYVTSSTELAFSVVDRSGSGIRRTMYRIDGGPWADYGATGPFTVAGDGEHNLEWYSEDNAGGVEPVAAQAVRVDDTPPVTAPLVGDPKVVRGGTFVAPSTPIGLSASDPGLTPVGLSRTEYRIDGGPWIPYAGPFSLEGRGPHEIAYVSTDLLGNVEAVRILSVILDDAPPAIAFEVGAPQYRGQSVYVTSATPIGLAAEDAGAGVATLELRIDEGAWAPYSTAVAVVGPDGTHTIACRGEDGLGNAAGGALTVVLDNTAPETRVSSGAGPIRPDTPFTVTADDPGSGVARTEYAVDGEGWRVYAGPFTLSPGSHVIRYQSVDHLGNAELEHVLSAAVEAPPTETNWKPVVAGTFALLLALVGAWSVRRKRLVGGPATGPAIRTFLITSLPFIVAEAATGVASYATGLLAIPPLLGPGTAVDGAILVAGTSVALLRTRRAK